MNIQLILALRYLAGRKLRTALTTLAILFGVLLIFGMNTLMPAFMAAFQANAMAMSGLVDVTVIHRTGEAFPVSILDVVSAVEGVRAVSGTLERTIGLAPDALDHNPAVPDKVTALLLVGADPETIRQVNAFNIIEGRFLQPGDRNAAIISQSLAKVAGLQLNQTLTVPSVSGLADLTVVGILPQRLLPGNEEVLVLLADAQRLLDLPDKINTVDINFDSTDADRRAEIEANQIGRAHV